VLFGDCRPLHSAAHGIAKLNHLLIHVFEEGYIRPDWVTLEVDGVNGNSTLSKDPDWYLRAAADLPPLPQYPGIASSFQRRAKEALAYYTHGVLQTWRFPHFRSHRSQWVLLEAAGWIKRFAEGGAARQRATQILEKVGERPYFVFPLQLNSDHQIRIHSPFGNMRVAMDYVIQSFARAAPADTGPRREAASARQRPGQLAPACARRRAQARDQRSPAVPRTWRHRKGRRWCAAAWSRSTAPTGTLHSASGCPRSSSATAVYDIPASPIRGRSTASGPRPRKPQPVIWDAFCRVLLDRCLVRGGFLSEEGLQLLIDGSVKRLTRRPLFDAASIEPAMLVR
jgi:capsular polysaccharide export protein